MRSVNITTELNPLLSRLYQGALANKGKGFVAALIGSTRGEGVSTIIVNLTRRIYEENSGRFRLCVIDANYDNPQLHRLIKTTERPGLTDYVLGDMPINEIIHDTEQASVIPFNPTLSGSAALQISSKLPELLAEIRPKFDLILIDCSPILVDTHIQIGSTQVDDFYLILKAHSTQREIALRALENLRDNGCPVRGVVLNQREFKIPRAFY